MIFRRKPLTILYLLILAMKLFSGLTLTCHRAEYQTGSECCPMCLPGSRVRRDCTEFTSTSCLPCLEGTFMNQPTGLKECFTCSLCDEASGLRTKTSCTATSDSVCEPLEGFYCVDPSENGCGAAEKHRSCEPGQYISSKGTASTDSVCSDCPDGTFSDGSSPSCQPHTQCDTENLQLLTPGTDSTDAQCGDISSNRTVIIIITVILVIVVIVIVVGILFCFIQNKACFKGFKKDGTAGADGVSKMEKQNVRSGPEGNDQQEGEELLKENLPLQTCSAASLKECEETESHRSHHL